MRVLFIILLSFALFFLVGCTLNPNKNIVSGGCCYQSDTFYTCEKSSNPVANTQDLYSLTNCGVYKSKECSFFNSTSGEILDANKDVIKDDDGNPIQPNMCSKNCNFDKANCTNQDEKNTCYSLTNPKTTYPICVNNSIVLCIQNQCKVWMCGEKKPTVKREYSFSTSDQETLKNNYKSQSGKKTIFDVQRGLVGKICEFRFMNASSYRLLSEQKWLVNSIRLGILGSFSDYEIAKYYFPPSDAFCSSAFNKNAVVESFIRYLIYSPSTSSFSPITKDSFCFDDGTNYICKNDPSIAFPKSAEFSHLLCTSFCSRLFSCPLRNLNFATVDVSPPSTSQTNPIIHYFLNISSYYSNLLKLYPDTQNYYRKEGEKGIGPEGAKAFECISDSDCFSNTCRKDVYFRGRCFDNSNNAVDCNCTLVSSCSEAFKCDKFPQDSIDEAECKAGKFLCEQNSINDELIVMCKYSPTTYDLYAYADLDKLYLYKLGQSNAVSVIGPNSWDGTWGVYDFSEFNKYKHMEDGNKQQLEFSNIVRKVVEFGCLNTDKKIIEQPKCNPGYSFSPIKKTCLDSNGKTSSPFCTSPSQGPQEWVVWKDNAEHLWYKINEKTSQDKKNDVIRWQWGYTFFVVPTNFVVSSTLSSASNKQLYIITSRSVSFNDLKRKFSFIDKCDLTHTNKIDEFGGDYDILEISIKDIPLQKHYLIEQYITPLTSHPYLLAGGNKLDFGEQEKKAQYLFDKTWIIKSFGKCQKDNDDLLKTKSYGLCNSCGTFLTLAYQNVSKTQTSYCPKDCGLSGSLLCFCPSSLYNFFNTKTIAGGMAGISGNVFLPNITNASPSTIPEFSYLINKIHAYLENNVIPVLDLKEYAKDGISVGGKEQVSFDYSNQFLMAPHCEQKKYDCTCTRYSDSDGSCIEGNCSCDIALPPDALFLFLNKDHSPVLSILDTLSSSTAQSKINNAKSLCPNCQVGLEYENILNIDSATNITEFYQSSGLNSTIKAFFGVELQAQENLGYPPPSPNPELINNKKVDFLVLNIKFSEQNKDNYIKAIENAYQLSKYVLYHVGKPTLWKLRFDGKFVDSPYSNPVFLDTLFVSQQNLTLSGVVGILLPSLLEKPENVLENLEVDKQGDSQSQSFCSLVNGSLNILQLSFYNEVKKLQAQDQACNQAACSECSPLIKDDPEVCNPKCLDGTACSNGFKCLQNCISKTYCQANKCEDKFNNKKITCYYMPSSSKYFTYLNKLNINTLEELFGNPDMPEIIASLNEPCCLNITTERSESYYTYISSIGIDYSSSNAIYPFFGSNDTNCGQFEQPQEQDPLTCSPTDLPSYTLSKKLYYCFWENK
ncbi:MAG: hypothetical protein ACK4J0_00255 [Candidatus Anstonellaceae archaeon]